MQGSDVSSLTIFVTGDIRKEQLDDLRAVAPESDVQYFSNQDELEARIGDADVVAGSITSRALADAKRLRWLHSWQAGPDNQLFPEMVTHPSVMTCSKGNGAVPLAEHAMMLMLLLNRQALTWLDAQKKRRWERFFHSELNGLTCGIIGLGYSGRDLALKAKAFHMRVLGIRRTPKATPNVDEVFETSDIKAFLSEADFVVVTAPLTSETQDLLGEEEFQAMKPSAYYICFSRGGIANDDALLKALQRGWIAGAGLDAHGIEPLPAESPFWTAPNTIITPHNAATTHETKERGVEIFRANLGRFVAGLPLENVVDKTAGY